jgi:hypothetical protein
MRILVLLVGEAAVASGGEAKLGDGNRVKYLPAEETLKGYE